MNISRRGFIRGLALAGAAVSLPGVWPVRVAAEVASTGAMLLPDFPVHKQETPYTCGPSSLRMVLEFFGHPLSEKEIARRMGCMHSIGTPPWGMSHAYNYYLQQFHMGFKAETKTGKAATNEVIFGSIEKSRPVIFTWMVENGFNPGHLALHYSVIIGFDKAKKEFTVANPFGTIHPLDMDRFWRMAAARPEPEDIPNVKFRKKVVGMPTELVVLV